MQERSAAPMLLSLDMLAMEVAARMDERLVVEHPKPYGKDISVQPGRPYRGGYRIIIDPPSGPRFAIDVREVARP